VQDVPTRAQIGTASDYIDWRLVHEPWSRYAYEEAYIWTSTSELTALPFASDVGIIEETSSTEQEADTERKEEIPVIHFHVL
jgi:hypothetical protein